MSNNIIKSTILFVLFAIILFSINTHSTSSTPVSVKEYTRRVFSEFLMNRLRELDFFIPEKIEEYLNILPSYPTASFKVVNELYLNETGSKVPAKIFSTVSVHSRVIVDYALLTTKHVDISQALLEAVGDRYTEAVNLFYNYVEGLRYGIPSGYSDPYRIVGIRQLDLPPYIELKYRIKPKLLAVFIGLSDGDLVKGPIYIYYFAFETTGTSFEGSYSKMVIVVSVVIDHNNVLYADAPSACGIVYYYSMATYSPVGSGYPVATVYGAIGLFLAILIMFIEYDEEYKYYLTLFSLFIIQLFSFLAICAIAGISIERVFAIVLSLGPWFAVLVLLWIPAYVFSTYKFFLISESRSSPSYYSAIFEGLTLAIVSIVLVLIIIFIRPFTEYLITTSGPGAVYFIVVALAGIDAYVGYLMGKLWATFGKYAEGYV